MRTTKREVRVMLWCDSQSRSLAIGWSLVILSLGRVDAAQTNTGKYDPIVRRALALLPAQPRKVLVVDASRALRRSDADGRKVQAFVLVGEDVVYLIAQGDALLRARNEGPGMFDYVVATLIWHEMAHIAGADEREAQRREEELWRRFLMARRINSGPGLRYLQLLGKRGAP
jgi:hypothetical protein